MSSNVPATVTDDAPDMFSDTRLQLIRDNVAKDAPENIFKAMIEIARVRGLDPLAKQISVIKFQNNWQVMTTIDGYRAIAESTGTYAGSDEPQFGPATITLDNKKTAPEWASMTVWKMVGGQRVPFSARVYWDEYYGNNFTWNKMPRTMLAKVAESHALRKGFPKVLSGLYTSEEMDQAGPVIDHASGEIIDAPQTRQIAPHAMMATRRQLEMASERWAALRLDPAKIDAQCRKWYGVRFQDLSRDDATDFIAKLDQKITASKQPEPSPALLSEAAAEPAGMDDEDFAQVVAGIDAERATVSGAAGADRFTD